MECMACVLTLGMMHVNREKLLDSTVASWLPALNASG